MSHTFSHYLFNFWSVRLAPWAPCRLPAGSLPAPCRLPAQCKPRHRGQLLVELRTVLQNCNSRTRCNRFQFCRTDCNSVSNSALMCPAIVSQCEFMYAFSSTKSRTKRNSATVPLQAWNPTIHAPFTCISLSLRLVKESKAPFPLCQAKKII